MGMSIKETMSLRTGIHSMVEDDLKRYFIIFKEDGYTKEQIEDVIKEEIYKHLNGDYMFMPTEVTENYYDINKQLREN